MIPLSPRKKLATIYCQPWWILSLCILFWLGLYVSTQQHTTHIESVSNTWSQTTQPHLTIHTPPNSLPHHAKVFPICRTTIGYGTTSTPPTIDTCTVIGNGVAVSSWSYLVSAAHLFSAIDDQYYVVTNEWVVPLQQLWLHDIYDLALVFVPDLIDYERILWANWSSTGQQALTKWRDGKPRYHQFGGIITAFSWRNITHTTPLFPSLSGSPLYSISGALIGINTAISNQAEAASYSIQIDESFISQWIEQIK